MAFSIITLIIPTLSIMTLSSIMGLFATFSINDIHINDVQLK
jgi:hypothetical protein